MKKLNKSSYFFAGFIFFLLLLFCTAVPAQAAGKTRLDCTALTLSQGHSAIVNLRNPVGPSFWSSDNSNIATVKFLEGFYDEKANEVVGRAQITAKGPGTFKIKVENNKKTYYIKVCVRKNVKTQLNLSRKTIRVGKSFRLQMKNAVNPRIQLSSYNKKLIKVIQGKKGNFSKGTEYATIKALKPGTANIKIKDGSKTYTCRVTIVR